MMGKEVILHLIPDDAYLAVRFTFWDIGAGGLSYTRSAAPVPEASPALLLWLGITALASAPLYRR